VRALRRLPDVTSPSAAPAAPPRAALVAHRRLVVAGAVALLMTLGAAPALAAPSSVVISNAGKAARSGWPLGPGAPGPAATPAGRPGYATFLLGGLLKGDHVPLRSDYTAGDPRGGTLFIESSNGTIVMTQRPGTEQRAEYVARADGESLYGWIAPGAPGAPPVSATVYWYPPFDFSGDFPVPPDPTEVQAEGSPTNAALCRTPANLLKLYTKVIPAELPALAVLWANSSHGAPLFSHFLDGTGTARRFPDESAPSSVSGEVKVSAVFKAYDQKVVQADAAKQALTSNAPNLMLQAASVHPVNFPDTPDGADRFWTFAGTQGMKIDGHASHANGRIKGKVTYLIQDSYGFGDNDKFRGTSRLWHFLQSVCGAPDYPDGARWFPDSVEVVVPFDQPGRPPV
jgi:hypothetical protein